MSVIVSVSVVVMKWFRCSGYSVYSMFRWIR